MSRISFEKFAIELAITSSQRSEDPYRKVGCSILNKEGRLLSIGYNGLARKHSVELGFWENRDERRNYIIHAETNALSCISRYDEPHLLASTLLPCSCCAINIAAYGIKNVLYIDDYPREKEAMNIFRFYNINVLKYKV